VIHPGYSGISQRSLLLSLYLWDLLTLVKSTYPPTQSSTNVRRNFRIGRRAEYPLTIHRSGRVGGPIILYAKSAQVGDAVENEIGGDFGAA